MAFSTVFIIVAAFVGVMFLVTLGTSGFVFFNVFRNFHRVMKNSEPSDDNAGPDKSDERRRALNALSQLPPGSAAGKCRSCGATIDSTAELSPDGRIRCNYCNAWSSIYES